MESDYPEGRHRDGRGDDAGRDGGRKRLDGRNGVRGYASIIPFGITTDGDKYFTLRTRTNHTIRKIVIATGEVTTLAGVAGAKAARQTARERR